MKDSVSRFSDRVENYVKYRPHYPRDVIEHLRDCEGVTDAIEIADIGCGTGISSELFLENGDRVIGVEPNAEMRAAAREYLKRFPQFTIVDGTAEATTLEKDSVDMVIAGQAFHWFDVGRAKAEFERILRPGGCIILMWNERVLDRDDFHREYERLLVKYSRDYSVVRHDKFNESVLSEAFGPGSVVKTTFPNYQDFDETGLIGRALSASYVPNTDDELFPQLLAELKALFAKFSENGRIRVFYNTNVFQIHV